MKKLVFLFVAVVAVSFASCGGNANNAEAPAADTVVNVDTVDTAACCGGDSICGDSVKVDSVKA